MIAPDDPRRGSGGGHAPAGRRKPGIAADRGGRARRAAGTRGEVASYPIASSVPISRGPVDVAGARLEPVGVAELHVPDPRGGLDSADVGSASSMFMWYVSARSRSDGSRRSRELEGLLQRVDHVVLVAVERLQHEHDALRGRRARRAPKPGQQQSRSSSARARRLERGSRRENMPYDAGVPTTPTAERREHVSCDFICAIASRRRSGSKAPKKCSISTQTEGIGTPSRNASRSSGAAARTRNRRARAVRCRRSRRAAANSHFSSTTVPAAAAPDASRKS